MTRRQRLGHLVIWVILSAALLGLFAASLAERTRIAGAIAAATPAVEAR